MKPCGTCIHPKAAEINAALARGDGPSAVVRAFGLASKTSLLRHRDGCLAKGKAPPAAPLPVPEPAPAAIVVTPSPERHPGQRGPGHPCETCRSPVRAEVERRLYAGEAHLAIEREVDGSPSHDSIRRHALKCIPQKIRMARAEAGALDVVSMSADLAALRDDARRLMDEALAIVEDTRVRHDAAPDSTEAQAFLIAATRTAGELVAKLRGVLELVGKLTGETRETAAPIHRTAEWPVFVKGIAEAVSECDPCSEAVEGFLVSLGRAGS